MNENIEKHIGRWVVAGTICYLIGITVILTLMPIEYQFVQLLAFNLIYISAVFCLSLSDQFRFWINRAIIDIYWVFISKVL